jgi:hypothetical protein
LLRVIKEWILHPEFVPEPLVLFSRLNDRLDRRI